MRWRLALALVVGWTMAWPVTVAAAQVADAGAIEAVACRAYVRLGNEAPVPWPCAGVVVLLQVDAEWEATSERHRVREWKERQCRGLVDPRDLEPEPEFPRGPARRSPLRDPERTLFDALSQAQLKTWCRQQSATAKRCNGGAPFVFHYVVSCTGRLVDIQPVLRGKPIAGVTACLRSTIRANFSWQGSMTTAGTCDVR